MSRVLVFGATSAIAAQLCERLAERGDQLYVVGRNHAKLRALTDKLGPSIIGSLVADLDETTLNESRVDEGLRAFGGEIDLAIVAHGALGDQLLSERDHDEAQAILRTNFLSPVSLLMPLANRFEPWGRGQILVLSSVAGERGRPRNYTYGSAKGGLTLYLQGMRSRLWSAGVRVHTIKLGPVVTPMTADHPKNRLFSDIETVTRQILSALDGPGRETYVPSFWAPIMAIVRRLPEPLFQRVKSLSGR